MRYFLINSFTKTACRCFFFNSFTCDNTFILFFTLLRGCSHKVKKKIKRENNGLNALSVHETRFRFW